MGGGQGQEEESVYPRACPRGSFLFIGNCRACGHSQSIRTPQRYSIRSRGAARSHQHRRISKWERCCWQREHKRSRKHYCSRQRWAVQICQEESEKVRSRLLLGNLLRTYGYQ